MLVLGTYPTRLHHHDLSTVTPWSRVTQCLDPSTIWPTGQERWRFLFLRQQRVVISTYHILPTGIHQSHRSSSVWPEIHVFLQYFYIQLFYNYAGDYLNPETVSRWSFHMFTIYFTYIIYIYMSNHFSQFWNLIFMPLPLLPPPNPTLYFNWYFIYTRVFLYWWKFLHFS